MAEQENAPPAESAAPIEPEEKKKKKKGLSLPLILAVVLVAQVAISYLLITQVLFKIDAQAPPVEEAEVAEADEKEPIGNVFLVPDLVVNPAGGGANPRYIKCGFGIEVDSEAAYAEVEARQPQVLDALIRILTSKRLEELDTPQEKDLMRMEIQEEINDRLIAGKVTNVYLTDFVIQ
jgi:flagellar FliL protein